MKVVIAYKWARDTAIASVRKDGSVDWGNAKMAAGDDDHAALAAAKDIAAASDGELIGLTIGDGDASWALARGVETTWSVADAPYLADNATTAAIIAAAVGHIGAVDVVVIGDADQNPGVPVFLAGALGWNALAGVATATAKAGRVEASRRVGDVTETVSLAGPLVLAVAAREAEPKAPGMKELLLARKRPVQTVTLAELGIDAVSPLEPVGTALPATAGAVIFEGDPDTAAAGLVAALRAEGVL